MVYTSRTVLGDRRHTLQNAGEARRQSNLAPFGAYEGAPLRQTSGDPDVHPPPQARAGTDREHVARNRVRNGLTRVVGPIILACAILYAIPPPPSSSDPGDGFFGRRHLRPRPHWRVGVAAGNHLPASGRDDMGRPLSARSPYPRHSAVHPLNQQGQCSVPKDQEKTHVFGDGDHGKSWRRHGGTCWRTASKSARSSAIARRRQAGRIKAWNWLTVIGMSRQPSGGRSKASKARFSCCRKSGRQLNQRARDEHGLVASGARISRPDIANGICARRGILLKLPLWFAGRPGRNATGLLQSDKPGIDDGRDERHRRGKVQYR